MGTLCPERTFIINNTQPIGVQFSHLLAEQVQSDVPAGHMAHENLFREPEFAPGTTRSDIIDEPVPEPRQYDVRARPRRTTRRRTAA